MRVQHKSVTNNTSTCNLGSMEIICGTYEELTIGFKLVKEGKDYQFETSFTDHSHTGNVKTVAVSQKGLLATGSSDESIKLFNLRSRKELGSLLHHDGSISALAFHGKIHMFSASEDGTIAVWRTSNWECLRTLKGHKDAVYDISIHPTGKMALSLGKDKTMRTWNLITGKCAYVTNIKTIGDHVVWTPAGDKYIVISDRKLDVYTVQGGTIDNTIEHNGRIHAVRFIGDEVMVVAGQGGDVHLYSTADYSPLYKFTTDTIRIKGLHCCTCEDDTASTWVVTGSSEGLLKLWKLTGQGTKWEHELVTELDMKFRITSMTVWREEREQNKDAKKQEEMMVEEAEESSSSDNPSGEEDDDNTEESSEEEVKEKVVKSKPKPMPQRSKEKSNKNTVKQKTAKRKQKLPKGNGSKKKKSKP